MLDFSVRLTLGDEEITEAELQALREGSEGLVLLKGRWVEVDREKLDEVLRRWKAAQRSAADGLSFVEAMRLLAGADLAAGDAGGRGGPGVDGRRGRRVARGDARRAARRARRGRGRSGRRAPDRRSAPTSARASAGSGSSRGSASAAASPTTWGSGRPSRSSPSCCS